MPDADAEARKTCRASEWKVSSWLSGLLLRRLSYGTIQLSLHMYIYIYV